MLASAQHRTSLRLPRVGHVLKDLVYDPAVGVSTGTTANIVQAVPFIPIVCVQMAYLMESSRQRRVTVRRPSAETTGLRARVFRKRAP